MTTLSAADLQLLCIIFIEKGKKKINVSVSICRCEQKVDQKISIIDNSCIPFKQLFGFPIQVACHFMNMVFLSAFGAAQADAPA